MKHSDTKIQDNLREILPRMLHPYKVIIYLELHQMRSLSIDNADLVSDTF
ncbi:MAG: hypothetical protein F6K14_09360 [Symploca sp. SIO2C1]|nr:hypothetical protein [Symploca sp. SIO2C1]